MGGAGEGAYRWRVAGRFAMGMRVPEPGRTTRKEKMGRLKVGTSKVAMRKRRKAVGLRVEGLCRREKSAPSRFDVEEL